MRTNHRHMATWLARALAFALCLAFLNLPVTGDLFAVTARAEGYTVTGTVDSRTTNTVLYLKNSDGVYVIKIDSTTSITGTNLLAAGAKVKVTIERGSDAYMHATSIAASDGSSGSSSTSAGGVTIDSGSAITVTGTVEKGSTDSVLKLNTSGGVMSIKIDDSTNLNGIRVLVQGRKLTVSTARGSDAYMHALSIADPSSAGASAGSSSQSPSAANISGTVVSGTVDGRTTQEILYLTNSDGTYQIKIDASTDLSECKAMVKGRKVTVGFNWGNDGYNHATKVVGVAESRTATDVDSANALTVRGTVGEATTEGMLRLINSDGEMKVKLDTSTNWGSCRTLVYKQNVTVTVARGSDGYMHALAINPSGGNSGGSSNGSASSSSGTPVSSDNALIVQGTVGSGTNEGMLYLSTSGGTMSIKIDGNTNFAASRSMMPGENIAVACYRGSDAYYHAFSVVNSTQPGSATVNASEAVTVSGTVESGTNGGLLVLKTGDGNMMIKLDNSTRMGGCKVLTQGRSVKVGVARGSDAYMHAVSID